MAVFIKSEIDKRELDALFEKANDYYHCSQTYTIEQETVFDEEKQVHHVVPVIHWWGADLEGLGEEYETNDLWWYLASNGMWIPSHYKSIEGVNDFLHSLNNPSSLDSDEEYKKSLKNGRHGHQKSSLHKAHTSPLNGAFLLCG